MSRRPQRSEDRSARPGWARARFVLAALAILAAGACRKEKDPPKIAVDPAPSASAKPSASIVASAPSASSSDPVPTTLDGPPAPVPAAALKGACIPEKERKGVIDRAWLDGDRVFYCMKPSPSAMPGDEWPDAATVACASQSLLAGDRREELPSVKAPKSTGAIANGFSAKAATKTLSFTMKGGLREPHDAKATVVAAGKAKTADVNYDEHVVFDGWIGDHVVLRTWVDEGPGCGRKLLDPVKDWPFDDWAKGLDLQSCYGTEDMVYPTTKGFAMVQVNGDVISFIDAGTLSTFALPTGHAVDIADGYVVDAGLDAAHGLVLVYGTPIAGDVVSVDLEKRAILSSWTPTVCKP